MLEAHVHVGRHLLRLAQPDRVGLSGLSQLLPYRAVLLCLVDSAYQGSSDSHEVHIHAYSL